MTSLETCSRSTNHRIWPSVPTFFATASNDLLAASASVRPSPLAITSLSRPPSEPSKKTVPCRVQTRGTWAFSPLTEVRVVSLKDSVVTLLLPSSWAILVNLAMRSAIFSAFLPASIETSTATGWGPLDVATTASATAPWGRAASSERLRPTRARDTFSRSSSLAAMSSLRGFISGSSSKRPIWLDETAARSCAASSTLSKKTVVSGSAFSIAGLAARAAGVEIRT